MQGINDSLIRSSSPYHVLFTLKKNKLQYLHNNWKKLLTAIFILLANIYNDYVHYKIQIVRFTSLYFKIYNVQVS